jgi:anti-sigma factor RsiW
VSHLQPELLVRAMDDELSAVERVALEGHLANCESCRQKYRELGALSVRIENAVAATPVAVPLNPRALLESALARNEAASELSSKRRAAGTWRWGVAMAATLVLGAVLLPRHFVHVSEQGNGTLQFDTRSAGAGTFELDGETFVALPDSNPGLPVSSARIVQMEVPVSSLADAGILIEAMADESADRSVLADVLLGADGEPRGVHVLSGL